MSIASIGAVTVTLILVGTFVAIMLNVNQMANKVEEDVVIEALIDLTAEDDDITALGDEIVVLKGFKNILRNGWMSIASIGAVSVTLILVGTFVAIMLNVNQMANKVEEDVVIKALIDLTAEDDEITALGDEIEEIKGVESVQFS